MLVLVSSLQAQRIPGRPSRPGVLLGVVRDQRDRGVPGVSVHARNKTTNQTYDATTTGEGIFRLRDLTPGDYEVTVTREGLGAVPPASATVRAAEVQEVDFRVATAAPTPAPIEPTEMNGVPGRMLNPPQPDLSDTSPYPGLRTLQPSPEELALATPEELPARFTSEPYRWTVDMPEWQRYGKKGEFPYVHSHWYDPFNRNRLKGDYPIFGQRWFFNLTATSETDVDGRRLPLPSGVSAAGPGESSFFGRGEQSLTQQTFRFSFDLFRGDTSFRPVDFRIRFTPAVNLNFLQTRERGLVNIDVRQGINRFDTHVGLQEGFVEAKLHDLSPNFDFVSVRAGIQQFNSDFRGFLFSEEQPGVRIFGNLRSNRINYNLAYFYFLEKDTNSELNTFNQRHQQVYIANVYFQDFLAKGYTTEFSFHYNRDDPGIHFDDNGFLVRPAPIGQVVNGDILKHGIRAYYLGWTSNGHIGRINVNHAFYQALGHDDLNPIAGRRVDINAQMGALELSVDKDWARFRASAFFQSGDGNNRSGSSRRDSTAHGFDTIVDDTKFAGGDFSFWDSEGIRLTSTGVALVNPGSLLASLRSNKFEGQANFVNPGLLLFNLGADFNVTPRLRAFVNGNYLRFHRTEPLEILLFQRGIKHSIGEDLGAGIEYRPPLTDNIIITAGSSTLVPGTGFEQIFNGKTLVSVFAKVKFQF